MTVTLAIDNGPTDQQWAEMTRQGSKYAPIIAQMVGYFVMCGAGEGDRDFPQVADDIAAWMPGYAALTGDEAYFIYVGAVNVVCHGNAFDHLSDMATDWLSDGAPE